ncbi:M23 family metallopeptidase [Nesterenkonia ebinurensis]|uniref:M23 family metallopeptidase n=1 Tax=Nesterenkonia ebinurensis TaxID=2608252 RepID=UPI00123E12F9|nr:M23 family metallopeptidase [Nesterenkonia ebinurensis]
MPAQTTTPPCTRESAHRHGSLGASDTSDTLGNAVPLLPRGRPLFWWPRPLQWLGVLLLALAVLGAPPANAAHPQWLPPVGGEALRGFEAPEAPWASGHRGLDLSVPAGGEIRSPADGVVSFSGVVVNREVLSINHGAGYVSSFEPVESDLEAGDAVSAGDVVAVLSTYDDGSSHCTGENGPAQPCLHWGVRLHGDYINPLLLTGDFQPSVLLPLSSEGTLSHPGRPQEIPRPGLKL